MGQGTWQKRQAGEQLAWGQWQDPRVQAASRPLGAAGALVGAVLWKHGRPAAMLSNARATAEARVGAGEGPHVAK